MSAVLSLSNGFYASNDGSSLFHRSGQAVPVFARWCRLTWQSYKRGLVAAFAPLSSGQPQTSTLLLLRVPPPAALISPTKSFGHSLLPSSTYTVVVFIVPPPILSPTSHTTFR